MHPSVVPARAWCRAAVTALCRATPESCGAAARCAVTNRVYTRYGIDQHARGEGYRTIS